MDYERTHRSGTTSSELFICFTSRPSSNSSSFMKVSSSKSIRSPSHNDKSREPSTLSISSSLNNRRLLRGNNGSIKAGQFSPMMFPTGSSKKRGCSFETPEPSSPKVTCIGQVRVKTKKRGKKILARKKRTAEVGFRNIDRTSSQEGLLNHHQQQHHQHSCLPYRNQKWVHFPLTICETLRSFGADLNCFLPCGTGGDGNRASISDRNGEEKRKNTSGGDGESTGGGSCGPFLDRWLMAFQEGEVEQKKTSEQVIEMMYGDEVDEEEIRERVNIMKMMEEVGNCKEEDDFEKGRLSMCLGDDFEKGRLSMCLGDDYLEKARGSVCLPPKNALLLMRCRSDPLRTSSLSRFWDSAVAKEDDNEDEFQDGVSEVDEEEEDEEVEEEEAMSSELDEECEVKECLEEGLADESQAGGNQEDPSKLEEIVTSIPAHPQGENDEEKQKSVAGLEQNEEVTSNGDPVIIEENPAAEEQPALQELEKNHELEHNSEAGEDPKTREQELVLQEVEDQEVKRISEAGDEPITEEQPFFQEIEDVQKVELNKVNVENSEIEDIMLQEVEDDQVVGSNTESVENLAETFMLRENEDQAVGCNSGSVENLKTEEEFRLQAVGGEQEVEHYTEAIENPITEEEEIVFEEILQPGIEESEEREMRSFEMFVEPQIEEPALVTAEGDQAILDLQEERLVESPLEEKGIEDITQDQENEKKIAEEACAIPVASEEQESQIHEDNEGYGEEKPSSTNEEVETVVREEQEAQNGNDNEEYEEKSPLADGRGETERKPAALPECMMWMMMSEPKLSMEVSKETWVSSGDFTRKPGRHGRVVDDSEARQPQLSLNNKLTDYMGNHPIIQPRQQRRLPTSCANNNRDPARRVVLSMASMIEQKLMKAVAYHQPFFVLSRCNSEPVRSSAKLGSEYKVFLNYQ
ncbi:hypothetical protein MKW98_023790 [Papaver atlanticum]|uniref:Uncharacterized protein n=1 Tax=Papaver atlanticum TaxID=357466 RepID=A0AAD4XMN3_9MAGN|nr:hypothetical protein MKW98_023790 [Papaver atlanticum]